MLRTLVFAIAFSLLTLGCSERYGGSIYPVPHIPAERPIENPSENDVISDLEAQYGNIVSAEIVEEVHSIESHVFFVRVQADDEDKWFKVTYYWVQDQWVCIPSEIEM